MTSVSVLHICSYNLGVLNHGREVLAFIDLQQWPHDANFTLNVILHILKRMEEIPDTFYIQMDNCWRENKNKFVIVFLAVLVKTDVFKKVLVSSCLTLCFYACAANQLLWTNDPAKLL